MLVYKIGLYFCPDGTVIVSGNVFSLVLSFTRIIEKSLNFVKFYLHSFTIPSFQSCRNFLPCM